MCTVSFFPQASGGFVFTSNRDETPLRPAAAPTKQGQEGKVWFGPYDKGTGGSWFGTNLHTTACLLNGAFVKHEHRPPYRRSRGVIVPELLQAASFAEFLANSEFDGMEPFTLVVIEHPTNGVHLHELRWDGQQPHLKQIDPQRPIWWQSATLYNTEQAALRSGWFQTWLDRVGHAPQQDEIFDFHTTAGVGNPELDLCMDRGKVRTTSITSLFWSPAEARIRYLDLLAHEEHGLLLF
jgi:hypothetical protein